MSTVMFVHMIVLLIAGIHTRCSLSIRRPLSLLLSPSPLGGPDTQAIHVAVVYANEMPLFIGNLEFYIQSTINF